MLRKIVRRRWVLAGILSLSLLYFISSTMKWPEKVESQWGAGVIEDEQKESLTRRLAWRARFLLLNDSRGTPVGGNAGVPGSSRCRNTEQGWTLVTDDHGYVCKRLALQANGCCKAPKRERRDRLQKGNRAKRGNWLGPQDTAVNWNLAGEFDAGKKTADGMMVKSDMRGRTEEGLGMSGTERDSGEQYSCHSCQGNGCCSLYEFCISCCLHPRQAVELQKMAVRPGVLPLPILLVITDYFELCQAKCRTSSQSVQHENMYRNPHFKYCYSESLPELLPDQ
uniref:SREBP regulating gene protein n=1 Tax=Myxine glutinosa TaxID=7769 RepID=UPI00358EF544